MKRKILTGTYKGHEYTEKTYYSTIQLVTGLTEAHFFVRTENQPFRNYKGETNPFDSSLGGRVMGLSMRFIGANQTAISIDQSTKSVVDAYAKLVNTGELELKRGNDVIDEICLDELLPEAPWLLTSVDVGTPTNLIRFPMSPVVQSPQAPQILKKSYKDSPLRYKQTEGISCILRFNSYGIPSELNGFFLKAKLHCQVFQSEDRSAKSNAAMIRKKPQQPSQPKK